MPGVGKTTASIELVKRLGRASHALWVMCKGYTSFDQALLRIASFIDSRTDSSSMVQAFRSQDIGENQKIEAVIRGAEDLKAVIILDDFSVFAGSSAESLIQHAKMWLREGILILTAPDEAWVKNGIRISTFHIPPLSTDAAKQMLIQHCAPDTSKNLNDERVLSLIDATHGHPLLIKLTASLLETFSAETLVADFEQFAEDLVSHVTGKAIAELSQAHLNALQYLCCFPVPFSDIDIRAVPDIETPEKLLLDLIGKSLIQKIGGDKFTVHSIIEVAVFKTLSEDRMRHCIAHAASSMLRRHTSLSIDEHVALIELYILLKSGDLVENLVKIFMHSLMSLNLYSLSEELLSGWLRSKVIENWDHGHFLMGRIERILGRDSEACACYRKSLELARDDNQRSLAKFELANCLLQATADSAAARQEAQELYKAMASSENLIHRAMGVMALCATSHSGQRVEYIPTLKDLVHEAEAANIGPLSLKLRASLGECLISDPSRKKEGLDLLLETSREMMESREKGQFVLALRHFLKRIRDEYMMDNIESALEAARRLVTVMQWTNDKKGYTEALYGEGAALFFRGSYTEACTRFIESLSYSLLPESHDVEAQAGITAWLAVALWNTGMLRCSVACQVVHAHLCNIQGIERKPFAFVQWLDPHNDLTEVDARMRPWLLSILSNDEMEKMIEWRNEFWSRVEDGELVQLLHDIIRGVGDDECGAARP